MLTFAPYYVHPNFTFALLCLKVCHSSNLLYQGFAEKNVFWVSTYIAKLKLGVSAHLSAQWRY